MATKTRIPSHRHSAIQRQLLMDGTVSVESLAQKLGVSVATIRRDLTMLEKGGDVQRTHGGATIPQRRGADQAFALREQIDSNEKRFIARAAVDLIEVDQTLFMNDGSTILALAHELAASNISLTAVTTGVNIATVLSENPTTQPTLPPKDFPSMKGCLFPTKPTQKSLVLCTQNPGEPSSCQQQGS